jgi:hypothetical protein
MKIALMTPTYDGQFCKEYVVGCSRVLLWARDRGHELIHVVLPGNAFVDQARNMLLQTAREHDCDEYVFVDADVGFDEGQFERLLSHRVGLVGGAYRIKSDEVERYPVEFVKRNGKYVVHGELVEVIHVPAGFMRIRRDCLAKMLVGYGQNVCQYPWRQKDGSMSWPMIPHLFDMGPAQLEEGGLVRYVGEDVHFCNLWRALGERVFLDPKITLTHTGEKVYHGDIAAYMEKEAKKEGAAA